MRYAKGFTVQQHGEFFLVQVTSPWPGAATSFSYLLKPENTTVKQLPQLPEDINKAQVVEIPVRKTIALSSTFIAFLEQLEAIDSLAGFSDISRVHSSQLQVAGEKGTISEVGSGSTLQIETVLDLDPDIIFTFATGSFRDAHPKLIEAGLKVAVIGDYMEPHPLGRAEWIKFFGLLFGKSLQAEEIFNKLEGRYLALAEKTVPIKKRPTVLTNTPFSGRWYVAGGQSYVGRLLKDAGADYIFSETTYTGAKPMDIELVYDRGESADFWVNTGIWKSLEQARNSDSRILGFRSLEKGKLFNNNKRIQDNGGNDYWESGIMAPDIILADLISIFHPDLIPDHQLFYYTRLH